MKYIKELIFGVRAKGETLAPPKLKLTMPKDRPTQNEWVKYVKFSSRYGTRGSFYNT